MPRRWTRPVLVTGLAAMTLLGAGIALGPWRSAERPAPVSATAPRSPADDLRRSIDRATARLARVPGDWQAWAQLGMEYLELARTGYDPGQYAPAEAALRRSLAVRPQNNAAALTGLGALAAARHDFAGALTHARGAVAADEFSADAYGVLTDALVELGRYPQAADAVAQMLRLRPDTGSYARASYLSELHGDTARATELMQRARDAAGTPGDITFALLHLGDLAFNAGDLATAATRYAEGLARRPGEPALLGGRARVAAARGRLPDAITDLRAATAAVPTVDHLVALSDALTAAGDPAAAARTDDLVRVGARLAAAGTAPTTPATTDIDLVLFDADRGESRAAVELGGRLLATRPSVTVETAYAWALHAAGRNREALTHADRGLRLGTRDARAHFQRGVVRLALGDRSGARRDLRAAVTINPYFSLRHAPTARALLTTLEPTA